MPNCIEIGLMHYAVDRDCMRRPIQYDRAFRLSGTHLVLDLYDAYIDAILVTADPSCLCEETQGKGKRI